MVFHPFIAGIMLAAVLAAIMSTISSQLIVTSSALIEDLYKAVVKKDASEARYVFLGRISILVVSLAALFFAWTRNETILDLVGFAWAGFGASFGPVILLSLYWRKITGIGALLGMVVGALTVVIWGSNEFLSKEVLYEIVPGFILSLVVTVVVSLLTYKPNPEINAEFDEAISLLKEEQ